jgi:hypothetical protein
MTFPFLLFDFLCAVGSGIFVAPTGVLASTGSVNLSILVWVLSGFFTMIGQCIAFFKTNVMRTVGRMRSCSVYTFYALIRCILSRYFSLLCTLDF